MATTGLLQFHEHSKEGNKDDYWAYWSVTVATINSIIQSNVPANATIDRVGLVVNSDYDGIGSQKAYLQFGFSNATESISDYVLDDTQINKEPTNYPSDRGVDVTNRFDKANRKFNSSVGTYFVMCVHTGSALISAQKAQYAYVVVDYTPHTHSYGSPTYTWSNDGKSCTAKRTCSCGAAETSTATITSAVKTAATCLAKGTTTYTAKFSASWATTQTKDVQDISAKGHTWAAATCTTPKKCSVCGVTEGSALGHNYVGAVTKQPTCTEKGVKTYTCQNDSSHKYTEEIPAKGHTSGTAVIENRIEATCTTAGSYDEVVYCTVCGAELSRNKKTIPAKGHSYTTQTFEPTETSHGYTRHTCSVCGDYYDDSFTYLITFKNGDGSTLETVVVAHGDMPKCSKTPTKASTEKYDYTPYTPQPWWPALVVATANKVYEPNFYAIKRKYTLKLSYREAEGSIIGAESGTYEYGTSFTVTAQPNEGYEFLYWVIVLEDGTELIQYSTTATFELFGDTIIGAVFKNTIPPEFNLVQMLYQSRQISSSNKVPTEEYFRIVVGAKFFG